MCGLNTPLGRWGHFLALRSELHRTSKIKIFGNSSILLACGNLGVLYSWKSETKDRLVLTEVMLFRPVAISICVAVLSRVGVWLLLGTVFVDLDKVNTK